MSLPASMPVSLAARAAAGSSAAGAPKPPKVEVTEGTPATYNDPALTKRIAGALAKNDLDGWFKSLPPQTEAPTTQAVATFAEVERALDKQLARWAEMRNKDLPAFNEQVKRTGLGPIEVPAQKK